MSITKGLNYSVAESATFEVDSCCFTVRKHG
jgi:hypothetical protein